nr:LuxR C-terminal-related transcriptional regulator [uncultured Flavobacterium sp.]
MQETNIEQWDNLFKKQKSHSKADNKVENPESIDSYIFIYDCFENSILYINNAFETLTDHAVLDFDLDFLINMIHPEDLNYFFESEEKGLAITNKLLFNEHFKYILSYTYRIKTKSGKYIRIRQQCQALEVNNSGHLTKTLVIHKKVTDFKDRPFDDYKVFDKSQNIYVDEENCYNLSKREFEILNLIKQGLNSQDISESLNISKNTVITHRKNILTKTNCNSFIELIKKISTNPF